jgi:hypothetical protein
VNKKCTKCQKRKKIDKFSKNYRYKDKLEIYCKKCIHTKYLKNYKKNKEIYKRTSKLYRKNFSEKIKKYKKEYYIKNKEYLLSYFNKWKILNKNKISKNSKRYREKNRNRYSYYATLRRNILINATPKWVNLNEIKRIYLYRPKGKVVDHIVPLKGKTVCGLHVPWNLQYLTKSQNSKKINKLIP